MFRIYETFKKFVIPGATISLLTIAAFSDIRLSSLSFMEKEDLNFMADYDGRPRFLASGEDSNIKILYFPMSLENRNKVNGKWLVYRYTDKLGKVEELKKIINLRLVGNSKVILDGDFAQEFRISFMSDQETLALVKKIDKGYEILELRKADISKVAKKTRSSKRDWGSYRHHGAGGISSESQEGSEGDSLELTVERVYNPSLNNEVLKGEFISGGITKQDNENFNDLNVTVNFGPGKTVTFDIPVLKLKNGGQFETEIAGETATGIITNSGVEGYRVRIASGKFAGTVMNFVSDEQMETLASQEEERNMQMDLQGVENNDYRDQVKEQVEYTQNHAADLRAKQAKPQFNDEVDAEYYQEEAENAGEEIIQEEDPEVVKSRIEDSGFAFGASKRTVASKVEKKENR